MTDRRTLAQVGEALKQARKAHSEAFLRYKALDPKRTDGQARAMADMDVDLVGAEVDWVLAREDMALKRATFLHELFLLAAEGTDATEPTPRTN